ncbi:MAG: hypothetical protein GX425_14125 [Peptococcaceae bacterium]|nr:hypothetical protein [Peptococcaceae bacterium]
MSEALGAKAGWDGATKTVSIIRYRGAIRQRYYRLCQQGLLGGKRRAPGQGRPDYL